MRYDDCYRMCDCGAIAEPPVRLILEDVGANGEGEPVSVPMPYCVECFDRLERRLEALWNGNGEE